MKQIKEPILITCSDGLIYSLCKRIWYKKMADVPIILHKKVIKYT